MCKCPRRNKVRIWWLACDPSMDVFRAPRRPRPPHERNPKIAFPDPKASRSRTAPRSTLRTDMIFFSDAKVRRESGTPSTPPDDKFSIPERQDRPHRTPRSSSTETRVRHRQSKPLNRQDRHRPGSIRCAPTPTQVLLPGGDKNYPRYPRTIPESENDPSNPKPRDRTPNPGTPSSSRPSNV